MSPGLLFYIYKGKKKEISYRDFRAGEEGIEPPLTVLETAALPLYYSPGLAPKMIIA